VRGEYKGLGDCLGEGSSGAKGVGCGVRGAGGGGGRFPGFKLITPVFTLNVRAVHALGQGCPLQPRGGPEH
jgi:hypothetical protein